MSNEKDIEQVLTPCDADTEVRRRVQRDILYLGWGMYQTNEDGSLRYVDPLSEEGKIFWEQSKQGKPLEVTAFDSKIIPLSEKPHGPETA